MGKTYYTDTSEATLVIIKPDGLPHRKRILKKFWSFGFNTVAQKCIYFTPEQAAEFYQEHEKKKYFSLLVLNLSKGPCLALILMKESILLESLILLTPHLQKSDPEQQVRMTICFHCVNHHFGNCTLDYKNFVHCSIGPINAKREINYIFPNCLVEQHGVTKKHALCDRKFLNIFIDGLFQITENVTEDPFCQLAMFLKEHNRNLPSIEYSKAAPIAVDDEVKSNAQSCDQKKSECSTEELSTLGSKETCACTVPCSSSSAITVCSVESEITDKTEEDEFNCIDCSTCVETTKINANAK